MAVNEAPTASGLFDLHLTVMFDPSQVAEQDSAYNL